MSTANKLFQAASGGAGGDKVYVEDVFGTFLYVGDTSATSRTLTTGMDFDDKGGLAWFKRRTNQGDGQIYDTVRSGLKYLVPSSSSGEAAQGSPADLISFNSDGVTIGQNSPVNASGEDIALWQFLKQPGFFDIQTYTGNNSGQTLTHDLECVPAMILIKRTDFGDDWVVYHVGSDSSAPEDYSLKLNDTDARSNNNGAFNDTAPTATHFTVGNSAQVSQGGASFVAYLFAGTNDSDSQIFGAGSDEAIIRCGSYTGNGSSTGPEVTVGFEPQWLMIKGVGDSDWIMLDIMRGILTGSNDARLRANVNGAETSTIDFLSITSTGFNVATNNSNVNTNGTVYTYMAIRRPMKTPEAGTEVFNGVLTSSDSSTTTGFPVDIGFPVDLAWVKYTTLAAGAFWMQRLTGLTANPQPGQGKLAPPNTTAQANSGELWGADNMTGYRIYGHTYQRICYGFKRATGFMDMVAYTGNGASSHAITHNLGVSPELIITKRRDTTGDWRTATNFSASAYSLYKVNEVDPATNINYAAYGMYAAKPTSTTFTVGSGANVNASGGTFISYLFGTVAGVSKVGSVVHSGTTDVDCGFSAGARFVMAKRADQNGDWYYWDTMRGIVAGNDDYLLLNSDAVEVTNTDYIDPLSSGFTLTSSFTAGTYIFLAIA